MPYTTNKYINITISNSTNTNIELIVSTKDQILELIDVL